MIRPAYCGGAGGGMPRLGQATCGDGAGDKAVKGVAVMLGGGGCAYANIYVLRGGRGQGKRGGAACVCVCEHMHAQVRRSKMGGHLCPNRALVRGGACS